MDSLYILRPDDFHCHLRDGEMLKSVVPYSNIFGKVVAMGNLSPPIKTGAEAAAYRGRIIASGARFQPIMSIMLTRETTPRHVGEAAACGVKVLKMIPAGTSTGSEEGVTLSDLHEYYPVLQEASRCGMIFSGHWELTSEPESGNPIGRYSREERAIPYLLRVVDKFPRLKIVAEHVTTAAMADVVTEAPDNVGATITLHHLGPYDWTDAFYKNGDIKFPRLYCKPALKSHKDIEAVRRAALSGNKKFFFGSDSAPHPSAKKTSKPYAAGLFTAPVAIPALWEIFQRNGRNLADFEYFVSKAGTIFYGLDCNNDKVRLVKKPWHVPVLQDDIFNYYGGITLPWRVEELD